MERKPKITFFYPQIIVGGVEKSLYNLLQKIYKLYDCTVAYTNGDSDFFMLNEYSKYAEVIKLDHVHYTDICVYESIYGITDKIDADYYMQIAHLNASEMGVRVTTNNNINLCAAVSKECARQFSEQTNKKCIVLYNELDSDIIQKSNEKVEKIFKKDTKIKIIIVSRIAKFKGFERISILADELIRQNKSWEIVIVGKGHQYKYEQAIREQLSNYDQISFIGRKENPYPYVKQATHVGQLSDSESMGLTLVEGQTLGVPSITTKYKTAEEFIKHKENGLILELNMSNVEEIVKLIDTYKLKTTKYKGDSDKFISIINNAIIHIKSNQNDQNKYKMRAKRVYIDSELNKKLNTNYMFYTNKDRAEMLNKNNYCDIIKIRKDDN